MLFGITILKDVKVVTRASGAKGTDDVKSIMAGRGVLCNINQGSRRLPIMNESQETALAFAVATLPPPCMGPSRKRKADVLDIPVVQDFVKM